jgi:DnaJ-class molecular chaperone
MKELLLNHTYLLKYGYSDILSSVTVLNITNKAYSLRWNRGLESNDTWEEKEYIHNKYNIVEDISDFVINNNIPYQTTTDFVNMNNILKVKTKWIQCPNCGGNGSVPNHETTAGFVTCPICLGAKVIPEVTEIS